MSKENNTEQPENNQAEMPEVEQELSKVATNPKQSVLILVGIGLVFLYLFYNFFISSGDKKPSDTPMPTNIVKPAQVSAADSGAPSIPSLPSPPKLEDPTPPPPPPAQVTKPTEAEPALPIDSSKDLLPPSAAPALPFSPPAGVNKGADDEKKRLQAKRKSAIVLVAGKPPAKTPEQLEQETDFKFRGDMNFLLGRGKLLEAIIETAVNTDFGGEIRAVISRDVYSEWGKNILIPKGSRVFGTYATGANGAYGRIAIEWNRIDLASGYSINVSGVGMDDLGRKGVQGRIDNKFKERFSNAILQSAFNITIASTLDTLVKPVSSSQAAATATTAAANALTTANSINSQNGANTTVAQICAGVLSGISDKTSSLFTTINTACTTIPTQQASSTNAQQVAALMSAITTASTTASQTASTATQPSQAQKASQQAFTDISDLAKDILKAQKFDPTITLDQGTPIKIYVNKDYKFPKAALKKVMK